MRYPLPLSVLVRPAEYGGTYTTEHMFGAESYWCTPSNPALPQQMVLRVDATDSLLERLAFDTRVPGYDTSAAREVLVEVSTNVDDGPNITWEPVIDDALDMVCLNVFVLPKPTPAVALRVTFRSNHGGPYLALARLQALGTAESMNAGQTFLPGTVVEALTPSGTIERGTVEQAGYLIRFSDQKPSLWVPARLVRRSGH